ncbi:hypothetical protein [Streptomyces cadmiisoli]|uniref:hypothetical protein n=1 Tax=Streptomyces cadmiisoli TaxID=2184053 RepID=UPI003D73DF49
MHTNRRLLTTAVAAAVLGATLIVAPHATTTAAAASCTTKWTAVQKVAARKPTWNEGPVATPGLPFVHYLRRGATVMSCLVAVGKGGRSEYRECGGIWRIVPGGQVPAACLKRK